MTTSGSLGIGNVWSTISEALAPAIRELSDIKIELMGTPVSLLRIHRSSTVDVYGQREETYSSEVTNNIILHYPLSQVQLFDTVANEKSETNAIDLMEFLPITAYIKFSGLNTVDIVAVEPNDLLIDVLRDEWNNKIPIKLVVNKSWGQFRDKYLIVKHFELTLQRGPLQPEIQTIVDQYVASLD